jgi:hypothetical protein
MGFVWFSNQTKNNANQAFIGRWQRYFTVEEVVSTLTKPTLYTTEVREACLTL